MLNVLGQKCWPVYGSISKVAMPDRPLLHAHGLHQIRKCRLPRNMSLATYLPPGFRMANVGRAVEDPGNRIRKQVEKTPIAEFMRDRREVQRRMVDTPGPSTTAASIFQCT